MKGCNATGFSVRQLTPVEALSAESLLRLSSSELSVAEELAKPHAEVWGCFGVDELLACALIWWVGDELQLVDISTAPAQRRRGAARLLLGELGHEARSRGALRIELEVRASNEGALGLYRALGFSTRRRRPGYYGDDDGLEMWMAL